MLLQIAAQEATINKRVDLEISKGKNIISEVMIGLTEERKLIYKSVSDLFLKI